MDQWQWYHSQSEPLAFASIHCHSLPLTPLTAIPSPIPFYGALFASCRDALPPSSGAATTNQQNLAVFLHAPPVIFASSDIFFFSLLLSGLNTQGL